MGKVVVVADFVYPNYLGGSARYVYDLLKGFTYHKVDFLLITRMKRGIFALHDLTDCYYEFLKNNNQVVEISSIGDVFKALKKINQDDTLHIHHPVLGLFFAFFSKVGIYTYFFQGPYHKEYRAVNNSKVGFCLRYGLQKLMLLRANKVFVLSEYMKCKVLEISKAIPVIQMDPIFDYEKFSFKHDKSILRTKYQFASTKKILFTSRRLTNRTGVLELVECFIRDFDPNEYDLIIVGKGELQFKLENLISETNHIHYYNYVPDLILVELMALSDVYVLPTRDLEGFGLVILEALAMKMPVVVSDQSGGAAEFISQYDHRLIFCLEDLSASLKKSVSYALVLDRIIDVSRYDYKVVSKKLLNNII